MPVWFQYLLYISAGMTALAAFITACGVLWTKVLRPFLRFLKSVEAMLPLMREMTAELSGTTHAFAVLDDIVAQFRSDSGSTLKDQVNRLEMAAEKQEAAAAKQETSVQQLAVAVASAALRAKDEREQTQRLVIALDRLTIKLDHLTIKVDAGTATSERIEAAAGHVAEDLAAAHARADSVAVTGAPGEAADASAQQTSKEKNSST